MELMHLSHPTCYYSRLIVFIKVLLLQIKLFTDNLFSFHFLFMLNNVIICANSCMSWGDIVFIKPTHVGMPAKLKKIDKK